MATLALIPPRFRWMIDLMRHSVSTTVFSVCLAGLMALVPGRRGGAAVPDEVKQAVVGIADDWDASHVVLRRHERVHGKWQAVGGAWKGRLGKSGLAWGRGLHVNPAGAVVKTEGDGRAPAGIFRLGGAFGHYPPEQVNRHRQQSYKKVSPRDLWVEDPASPLYNHHVVLDYAEPRTPWEKKQQMKQKDPAHALKLLILHNTPPDVVPGAGSAIFFHVWRSNGRRPSTGCTTMPEFRLREMLAWLNPSTHPVYILLPARDYEERRTAWKLP